MCSRTGSGREQGRQSAVADEGCGYAYEGEEVFGLAFVAAVQTSATGKPGHRSFDDPAVAAQPGGGLDALAGDAVTDSALTEPSAQVVVVVPLVGVELGRAPTAWAASGADGRDPTHERLQAEAVVRVGAGDTQGQGQSVPVGDQVDFRSRLAAVGRIRSGQRPPLRPGC